VLVALVAVADPVMVLLRRPVTVFAMTEGFRLTPLRARTALTQLRQLLRMVQCTGEEVALLRDAPDDAADREAVRC